MTDTAIAAIVAALISGVVGPLLVLKYKRRQEHLTVEGVEPAKVRISSESPSSRVPSTSVSAMQEVRRRSRQGLDSTGYPDYMGVAKVAAELRQYVREKSPKELIETLAQLPPLDVERVGEQLYRGKWARWSGALVDISDDDDCYSLGIRAVGGGFFHVTIRLDDRHTIDHLRPGDHITVDGQIVGVSGRGGVDLVRSTVILEET